MPTSATLPRSQSGTVSSQPVTAELLWAALNYLAKSGSPALVNMFAGDLVF